METKICIKCNQEKPIEDFPFRNKAAGIRRSNCKKCHSEYMKNIYKKKKDTIQEIKSTCCCSKCGYNKCPEALDFHHIDPNQKEEKVSSMISHNYNLDKVKDEIQKCIVLCANCHREFHYYEKQKGITIQDFLEKY